MMLLKWIRKRRRRKIDREIERLNARLQIICKQQRKNEARHTRMERMVVDRRKELFQDALRGTPDKGKRGPL